MNLKIWVGVLISALLLWLSARNVEVDRAWAYIQSINAIYLIPYAAVIILETVGRAWKWQLLLLPIKSTSFLHLNSATLIGLMANNVLPARAGEFIRALVLSRIERIPYSACFATVVVDRVFDGITVSAIFVVALFIEPLPDEIKGAGYAAAGFYLAILIGLVGLIVREDATLRLTARIIRFLPARIVDLIMHALYSFVRGLDVFRSPKLVFAATMISLGIWIGYAISLHLMFLAFGIDLSFFSAFVVLLILTIVLTLPTTPGFVGAMEWAITFGLKLYGVDDSQAFALAVVYHVTQYVPVTLAGAIALWAERLSLAELSHAPAPAEGESGAAAP